MTQFSIVNKDVMVWGSEYTGPKFHALFSDFPYDLGLLNKAWDKKVPFEQWGLVLKPMLLQGAPALVFGGTRTWHRLAIGLENAGFEMWDTIMWVYGTGFPKAQEVSELLKKDGHPEQSQVWMGYRTMALKPAWEPILCFKSPMEETYAITALNYGSGALNADACRIGNEDLSHEYDREWKDNTGEVGKCWSQGGRHKGKKVVPGRYPANFIVDEVVQETIKESTGDVATRFFYAAKTSNAERNAGLPNGLLNNHPTPKPIMLTTYIAKLLLPPASIGVRRILVPFSGSGSEMIGCLLAGWDEVLGIELDPRFAEIAKYRCQYAVEGGYDQFIQ